MSSDVELDYQSLMDSALRAVVRDVLSITAELGAAPGEHHFYIEFQTGADGVMIPETLQASYPDRMTIVLQHQFKDLEVGDDGFSVTLWFKGEPSSLVVPFDAITTFADPSVQFELRYADAANNADDAPVSDAPAPPPPAGPETAGEEEDDKDDARTGDVVSLDAFRKK